MDNGYGTADGQSKPYICFATNIILYSQKHSNIKGEWIGRTVLLVFFSEQKALPKAKGGLIRGKILSEFIKRKMAYPNLMAWDL